MANAQELSGTAAPLTFTPGDDPVPVDPGLTFTAPSSYQTLFAQVAITGGYESGDILAIDNNILVNNVTSNFDDGLGNLVLFDTDAIPLITPDQWQIMLRAVTYHNMSGNLGTQPRTLRFRVGDGTGGFQSTFYRSLTINTTPRFIGDRTLPPIVFNVGREALTSMLTAATGGNGTLTYSMESLRAGLSFDPDTRRISGVPTAASARQAYTYTVIDADDDVSESDADSMQVFITVNPPPNSAAPGGIGSDGGHRRDCRCRWSGHIQLSMAGGWRNHL